MVDRDKLRTKIQFIEHNTSKLQQLKNIPVEEFIQDFRNVEAAKHLLQVNVEAMLDIANHIIARNRWSTPATSADSIRTLSDQGFFSNSELNIFLSMVKFRNRIVHIYNTVDEQEIYKILQDNLDDFMLYIKVIVNKIF